MAIARYFATYSSKPLQWEWAASGAATPQSDIIDLGFTVQTLALQVYAGKWPSAAALYLQGSLYSSADVDPITNDAGILSAVPSATVTGKVIIFTNVGGIRFAQVMASGVPACSGEAGSGYIVAMG